ncbi:MAG: branched-chain amino acid ABC transporter permease [Cohaesibacteraceae bacterium]|nr:branched-chain amino acid ABC transporter permease [Cohaesibacteraceae bacterium]MBL4876585.1 branched-chain amino acid ABC transporter permease [Cohaesibacteraceae bacterium]
MFISTLLLGVMLGSIYALVALGLTVQYGLARIMNLAYGEIVIVASFAAFVLYSSIGINPVLTLIVAMPAGYFLSWVIYAIMMRPLVKRSGSRARLEVDTILATFGLMFALQGLLLVIFGGNFTGYTYLNTPVDVLGVTIAANRVLAFGLTVLLGGALYYFVTFTRRGVALRAVSTRPENALLVGIDVNKTSRMAFALGGALAASAGVVLSMYQTFTATSGVAFTMKALVVVILGGAGNPLGALCAGLLLGIVETFVSTYIDPGLTLAATYAIFLVVLLVRPTGLFGKAGI